MQDYYFSILTDYLLKSMHFPIKVRTSFSVLFGAPDNVNEMYRIWSIYAIHLKDRFSSIE